MSSQDNTTAEPGPADISAGLKTVNESAAALKTLTEANNAAEASKEDKAEPLQGKAEPLQGKAERIVETPFVTTIAFREERFFEATVAALATAVPTQKMGLIEGASIDEIAYAEFISPRLVIMPGAELTPANIIDIAKRGFQSVYCFMYTADEHQEWKRVLAEAMAEVSSEASSEASKASSESPKASSEVSAIDADIEIPEDIFSPEGAIGNTRFYSFGVDDVFEVAGIDESLLATIVLEKMTVVRFPEYSCKSIGRADANNLYAGIESTGRPFVEVIEEIFAAGPRGYQLEAELTMQGTVISKYRQQVARDLIDVSGVLIEYEPVDIPGSLNIANDVELASDRATQKNIAAVAVPATVFVNETAHAAIGRTNKRTGDKYELAVLYKYEEKIPEDDEPVKARSAKPKANPVAKTAEALAKAEAKATEEAVSRSVLKIISAKPIGGYKIRMHGPAAATLLDKFVGKYRDDKNIEFAMSGNDAVCWVPSSIAATILPFLNVTKAN